MSAAESPAFSDATCRTQKENDHERSEAEGTQRVKRIEQTDQFNPVP